jgi:5-methylcytosine-specific restriction endonuclease McrA
VIDPQDMTRKFGALDQSVVGSHTEREWLDLLTQWNWLCFYCGEFIQRGAVDSKHEATKDHMTPISRGGVDFIGNIVPACLRCNQLKGESTVEEFRADKT